MPEIGNVINDFFSPLGVWGGLLCIFVLFYIDAIIFPTLPELFTMLIFTADYGVEPLPFAVAIMLTISVAEIAGLLSLYYVVKKAKLPKWVQKAVKRYQAFLLYPDERMILLNRIAPILPFLGAFVASGEWNLRKSIFYTLVGSWIKYGAILAMSALFIAFLDRGLAQITTMVMILIVIAASIIVSMARRKKMGGADADRPA
jgi:membrane protein DedA with SNARE-associated domain